MGRTVVATAATKSRLLAAPKGGHTAEARVSGGSTPDAFGTNVT
jgi:hypothetical protein